MSIGARLKEERERLGYSQEQFAVLVSVSRKSLIRWEQEGGSAPDAHHLAVWCALGLNVVYVLTGDKSNTSAPTHLPPDEQMLLESYRALPVAQRKVLLAELLTGTKVAVKPKRSGTGVSVEGNNNRVAGGDYNEK